MSLKIIEPKRSRSKRAVNRGVDGADRRPALVFTALPEAIWNKTGKVALIKASGTGWLLHLADGVRDDSL